MKINFIDWILLETENLLVINKPPHIASLDERTGDRISVLQLARKHCATAQLCHRIDKETTGVLLIAKNPETYREVSMAFENRKVNKIYHAITQGRANFQQLAVDLPISAGKIGKVRIDKREGKEALTIFQTLEMFENFTLVDCRPLTGRMHQIRIHLASQNTAIAGDILYGGEWPFLSKYKRKFKMAKFEEEQPMINRFSLHAQALQLQTENLQLDITAPYPKDMEVFLKLIRKYNI